MDSADEIMQVCRLCLVKEEVNTPIFDEEGDDDRIFLKISTCLPVKVSKEDNLPKNICDGCSSKLEELYEFWNKSASSEKKLVKWLCQLELDKSDKMQHSMNTSDPVILKQEVVDVAEGDSTGDDLIPEDLNVSNDAPDYMLQEQLPYQPVEIQFQQDGFETTSENSLAEKETKGKLCKRRAAAMKALASFQSEDEDDADLVKPKIAKTEDPSDESGEEPEPTAFVSLPSGDNEQPGPSGVGKSSNDAPAIKREADDFFHSHDWSNRLPEIDVIPIVQGERRGILPNIMLQKGYKNPFNYTNCDFVAKVKQVKGIDNIVSKWTCIICNMVMKDKVSLIDHYENHKNENNKQNVAENYFKCIICTQEFTSSVNYEKHLELKHGENRYACGQCSKNYKSCYYLCLHNTNIHFKDQKYRCVTCNFITMDRYELKLHLDEHEDEQKHECDICDKKFFSSSLLDEHKHSHVSAMPFQCDICLKSFPYAHYLISHKKSMHLEEEANKCGICDQQFAHKKSLFLHIRSHTGENSVLCDMCGKSLSSTEHLKQHLRIHTGYKPHACSVCGKGFAKKSNLTLHERVHSGEKPYVCKECDKCFSQRSTLVIHERYHSGERPYLCPMCNKGFVAKGLLGVHIKSCTRISL